MDSRQASAGEVLGKLGLHTVALLHERIAAERRTSIERRNTIERRGSVSLSLKQRGPAIPPQTLSPEQKEIKRRIKKRQETGWASAPDRAYRPLGTPDLVRPKGSVAKVAKDEVPPFGGARDIRPDKDGVRGGVEARTGPLPGTNASGMPPGTRGAAGIDVSGHDEELQTFVSNEPRLPERTRGNGYNLLRQAVGKARQRCLQCKSGGSFVDIVNTEHKALQEAAARSPRPVRKSPAKVGALPSPARMGRERLSHSHTTFGTGKAADDSSTTKDDVNATPSAARTPRGGELPDPHPPRSKSAQPEVDLIVRDFRAREKTYLPWHNRRNDALRDSTGGFDASGAGYVSTPMRREEIESQLMFEGGAMGTRDMIRSEAAMYLDGTELMAPAGFVEWENSIPNNVGGGDPSGGGDAVANEFLKPHKGLDEYVIRFDATRELLNRKLRKDLMNLTAERVSAARAKSAAFDEITSNATGHFHAEEWRLRSEQQRLRNQLGAIQKHPWYGRLLRVITHGGRFASPAERHLLDNIKHAIERGDGFGMREFAELLMSMKKEDFACPEAQRVVIFLKEELGVSSTEMKMLLAKLKHPVPYQILMDEVEAHTGSDMRRHRSGTMSGGFNAAVALRTAHSIGKMAVRAGQTFGGANMPMSSDWRSRLDQAALHGNVMSKLYQMQMSQQGGGASLGLGIAPKTPLSQSGKGTSAMTSGLATPGQGTGGPSSGRGADGTRKMSEFMQAVKSVEKTAGDDTSSAMSGGGVSMKKANLV